MKPFTYWSDLGTLHLRGHWPQSMDIPTPVSVSNKISVLLFFKGLRYCCCPPEL